MFEKLTETAKQSVKVIKSAPDGLKKGYEQHRITLNSVFQVDENIFMLNYKNDYKLDLMLESGVKSVPDLLKFCSQNILFEAGAFKAQENEFGCTTFNAFTPDGDHIMGRNFDYKDAPTIVVWTKPENGYASVGIVDCNFMIYGPKKTPVHSRRDRIQLLLAPYCCVDGINEKGLAIAVVEIKTSATNQNDPSKKDITTSAMIRMVLDKAATCEEAVELISQYNMHDSVFCNYHYQISDASGKSVIVEYVNNEMRVLDAELDAKDGRKCTFLANYYKSEDGDNSRGFGYDRGKKVNEKLNATGGILTEEEAMKQLEEVHLNYAHERYPWDVITLWSAVYNCSKCELSLAAGLNYDKVYKFTVAEPCVVS